MSASLTLGEWIPQKVWKRIRMKPHTASIIICCMTTKGFTYNCIGSHNGSLDWMDIYFLCDILHIRIDYDVDYKVPNGIGCLTKLSTIVSITICYYSRTWSKIIMAFMWVFTAAGSSNHMMRACFTNKYGWIYKLIIKIRIYSPFLYRFFIFKAT